MMKSKKYMMNIYEDNNRVAKKLERYLNSTILKMYKDEVCKIEVMQGSTIIQFDIVVYFLLGSGNSRREEILNKTWDLVFNATGKSSAVFTKIIDVCDGSIDLYESIRRILKEEANTLTMILRRTPTLELEFEESLDMASNMLVNINKKGRGIMDLKRFIVVTTSILMDGIHHDLISSLPFEYEWYDEVEKTLKEYYKDRIEVRYRKLISEM